LSQIFKLTLAYDGTNYVGWQRQAAGASVQGVIEEALRELDGREVTLHGAGRTDAGVHALGQVASCALDRVIEPEVLMRALNARLPADVRVMAAHAAPPQFHARFDAFGKTYRYRIYNADALNPFERHFAWFVFGDLDVDAMDAAARSLEGRRDFAAFQTAAGARTDTERTVTSSRVRRESSLVIYEVSGDGFLRHMVRAIVGTLVEIGRGQRPSDSMRAALDSRDRANAGPTAPARGLFLVGVEYRDL
jgi:tRNA pseudouridine38-40 synthase